MKKLFKNKKILLSAATVMLGAVIALSSFTGAWWFLKGESEVPLGGVDPTIYNGAIVIDSELQGHDDSWATICSQPGFNAYWGSAKIANLGCVAALVKFDFGVETIIKAKVPPYDPSNPVDPDWKWEGIPPVFYDIADVTPHDAYDRNPQWIYRYNPVKMVEGSDVPGPATYFDTEENVKLVFDPNLIGYGTAIPTHPGIYEPGQYQWYLDETTANPATGYPGVYYLLLPARSAVNLDEAIGILLDGPGMGNEYMQAQINVTLSWEATQILPGAVDFYFGVGTDNPTIVSGGILDGDLNNITLIDNDVDAYLESLIP